VQRSAEDFASPEIDPTSFAELKQASLLSPTAHHAAQARLASSIPSFSQANRANGPEVLPTDSGKVIGRATMSDVETPSSESKYSHSAIMMFCMGVLGASVGLYSRSKGNRLATPVMVSSDVNSVTADQSFTRTQDVSMAVANKAVAKNPAVDKGYGENMFFGAVAEKYMKNHGASAEMLNDPSWVRDIKKADIVAKALVDWALDRGATVFCHVFQPMGSGGVRHGQVAMVQLSMLEFDKQGKPFYELKGKDILQGETDGSSFPNGGMRATHTAGGYLALDPISPIFLRNDTIFLPACFVSYNGDALDEKTPLHRAVQAMSTEGKRLFKHLGLETKGMVNNIGLEQEFFLVPREEYFKRPDLQLTGRTVMGAFPARGQEMSDHYMGPPSAVTPALSAMKEIQDECFKIGIPLKTRHREVAPNQYEMCPLFGNCIVQIDQNLMVMQLVEEIAAKHGLAALLQEKPFAEINGNGKHNNWSLATLEGAQLLNPPQLLEKTGNDMAFPVVMAALVSGVDKHGDLMRLAISSPGNDFRLGAMEAPPAVMSMYLGKDMTDFLKAFSEGGPAAYNPETKTIDFGTDAIAPIKVPAEDRNRTSPFPYGGARFEFRAVGSSQNVSLVNTVLNTIAAEGFKVISDRVDAGEKLDDVARDLLREHLRVVFNGNGYDPEWPQKATELGIWRIDSGIDAIKRFDDQKNVELFEKMGIFSAGECSARRSVLLEHYVGMVEMEAKVMIDMISQHVLRAADSINSKEKTAVANGAKLIQKVLDDMDKSEDEVAKATLARELRLEIMVKVRESCDKVEKECPPDIWTLGTYENLLFLDTHTLD
jgi:glutamine synthetase